MNSITGFAGLVPVVVFLVVALGIAVYSRQRAAKGRGRSESGVRGISLSDLQQRLIEFMQLVKQEYGKYPLLYSQYGFYNKMLAPEFNKYFIFIARYGKSTPNLHGPGKHNIWQFTEKGRVPGISGHVDLDKFDNGTTLRDILLH